MGGGDALIFLSPFWLVDGLLHRLQILSMSVCPLMANLSAHLCLSESVRACIYLYAGVKERDGSFGDVLNPV